MSYRTYWQPEHVRKIIMTESRQKARDLFLSVHRPFRHIRVDFCKEPGSLPSFITEDDLRAIVQSAPVDAHNRLFFVVGEAGSGKSELCQWLEYSADPSASLPVHIPRSMTTAAHVAAVLRRRIGDRAVTSALQRTPISTQARYVALSAVVLLYERGLPSLLPASLWEQVLLSDAMTSHISSWLTIQQNDAGGSLELLPAKSLAPILSQAGIRADALPLVAADLQALLVQAVDQTIWMGDLRSMLSQLSDQVVKEGRRPLLLLEDITAFQLFGDLLLDFLLDLTSGHFDAVIGVTSGFERTQLARATLEGDLTHIHHRLRARFVLTDDSGRSYGLEDDLLGFARSYLGAARQYLPLPAELDNSFGMGLYPFTATFLHRAFGQLSEEGNSRQTPRLFIEHVLGAALLSSDLPSLVLDRSSYISPPPTLFRTDEIPDSRLQSLLRWYGELEDDVVSLDYRIPEAFAVPVPPNLLQNGRLRVTRTYIAPLREHIDIAPDWQQELRELQHWLATGNLYPSRETLKRGIERLLLHFGDPRSLANPYCLSASRAELYYARGDERLPIYLEGDSGDQPSGSAYMKVQVSRNPEERILLEELAYLALSGSELHQVCQNLALTLNWGHAHWNIYNQHVSSLLADRLGGISPGQLLLYSWRLLCALTGEASANLLPINLSQAQSAYDSFSPWSATQHRACYVAGEALLQWQETFRRLFIGAFMLRDTQIDYSRYHSTLSISTDSAVLEALAELSLPALRTLPFKVRPNSYPLYDLLVPLRRYAQALRSFDAPATLHQDALHLDALGTHLRTQLDLDHLRLREQLITLRQRCGEVGVVWRDSWDSDLSILGSLNNERLHALLEDLQAAHAEAVSSQIGTCDIWIYQQFRHHSLTVLRDPYWRAIDTVGIIQSELLNTARKRYRRDARTLAGTPRFLALTKSIRAVWQELSNGK